MKTYLLYISGEVKNRYLPYGPEVLRSEVFPDAEFKQVIQTAIPGEPKEIFCKEFTPGVHVCMYDRQGYVMIIDMEELLKKALDTIDGI